MCDSIQMKLACPDCGCELIKRPDDFDFENNFVGASCADCGREITKDDAIQQGKDVVTKQLNAMLGNAFKGTGFKFK
ncbi:TPA: ECs_2282 family putative zinc-binding protein [Citrobacter freundii]|uniref:ECs_2282 family putative zinc-binding protein n=2 Tax=Enterobacterales TaxID=91347 RepID=UPI0018A34B55|nr:hypothetical protein KATP_18960 [Kluyvera ascorbata]